MFDLLAAFKRKRCACFALLAMLTLLVMAACASQDGSWVESADTAWYESDKEASSYTISTPEELAGLAVIVGSGDAEGKKNDFKGRMIILAKDIDLSGKVWSPVGNYNAKFAGAFDGRGHTISGLGTITPLPSDKYGDYGLFGCLGQYSSVKNFILKGDVVASGDKYNYIGTVAGRLYYSEPVENCSFTGRLRGMTGKVNGGIIGYNEAGTIRNCSASADITADAANAKAGAYMIIGGILGKNFSKSTIENSAFTGSIKYDDNLSRMRVGGIIGENSSNNCIIQNCVVSADIDVSGGLGTDSYSDYNCAGGVAGYNDGPINNVAVAGTVKLHAEDGKNWVAAGGIAGVTGTGGNTYAHNSSVSCKVSASSLLPEKACAGALVGYVYRWTNEWEVEDKCKIINNRWVKGEGVPAPLAGNWNEISGDIGIDKAIVSNDAVESESNLPASAVLTTPLIRLVENKSFTLAATVYPTAAYNKTDVMISWNVSDPSVASLTADGASALVRGLAAGFTKINLSCGNLLGGENTYTPVTGPAVYRVKMEGLELSPRAISLDAAGASADITATILPDSDTPSYPVLKWTYEVVSGDNASADDILLSFGDSSLKAKVTLKNHVEGAVYRITAAAVDDSSLTDSILLTATAAQPSGGGSSGGCNAGFAGFAALALFLPCALLFRKKG